MIGLYLLYESAARFINPSEINAKVMLVVGAIALIEDVLAAWVLSKEQGLNVRAAMIHMIADAAATVGVILGALGIMFWGITWLDPAVTALIAAYVLVLGYHEIRKAIDVLMDTPPPGSTWKRSSGPSKPRRASSTFITSTFGVRTRSAPRWRHTSRYPALISSKQLASRRN